MLYMAIMIPAIITVLMDNRQPAKTMAWILVLAFMPFVGIIFYIFFGQNTRKERLISDRSMDQLTKRSMLEFAEQENLRKEVSGLEAELRNAKDMRENIDEFMSRIKKYLDVTVITREMMLELFDKIIIGEKEPPNGAPRLIQLVYKVDIDSVL